MANHIELHLPGRIKNANDRVLELSPHDDALLFGLKVSGASELSICALGGHSCAPISPAEPTIGTRRLNSDFGESDLTSGTACRGPESTASYYLDGRQA